MALWKIESVGDSPRKWKSSKGGENVSYRIKVKTKDGSKQPPRDSTEYANVELVQRETTAAPVAGGDLDGTIEEREYESGGEKRKDLKFSKTKQFGGGGGGGRGWQPRIDDDPVVYAGKQAAIAAQTSIERATELVVALWGEAPDERGAVAMADDVLEVAAKYEDHIQERAKAAGKRVREAKSGG